MHGYNHMIRIILVDDQKTVTESIRACLEPVVNFEIVATARNGLSAIEQIEIFKPDIVLMDIEMPVLDGLETTAMICRQFIGVKVIVLSMHDSNKYVSRALQAGASGYLLKNTPNEELIQAIHLVNRGYSQFAPGLVNKIAESIPQSPSLTVQVSKDNNNLDSSPVKNLTNFNPSQQYQSRSKSRNKKFYLSIWLLSNLILWIISLAYLQFKKPTYTSKWAITIPSSNLSTNVDIPEIGQASSQSESPFNTDFADPRENYKYLVENDEFLKASASKISMTVKEFGKPKIMMPINTTLIQFQIQGDTPQLAQTKALILQNTLEENLERLRQDENGNQSKNLAKPLTQTKQKLATARQKLADFQHKTQFSLKEQPNILVNNIEQLRRQSSEVTAEQQKVKARCNQLLIDMGISSEEAADALILNSDSEFQKYLNNHSQISAELTQLKSKYLSNHPSVVAKQAEKDDIRVQLYRRGDLLLGRTVDQAILKTLNINSSNLSGSQRANLFEELISLRAEQKGLENKAVELKKQITSLETKVAALNQYSLELQKLQRDVQLSEAVFSSTSTKAELNKSLTSAAYPPISLISQPNLVKEPTTPNKNHVLFGSFFSSLLLTTGLFSLWLRDQRSYTPMFWQSNSNHNSYKVLSNSNNNI